MDMMTLASASAVVAFAGFTGLVVVLRSRFQLLAAHIDADMNRMPHARSTRRKAARRPRDLKAGQLARLGYHHHRETDRAPAF